jgi:guanylate kinase
VIAVGEPLTTCRPELLVISGPSGAGKGTLIEGVLQDVPMLGRITGVTTRPARPGEVPGRQWDFISDEDMDAIERAGGLVDCRHKFDARYGLERGRIRDGIAAGLCIVEADLHTLGRLRSEFACFSVLVTAPTREERRQRLLDRGTSEDDLPARLAEGTDMLAAASRYDAMLVNDELDVAREQLVALAKTLIWLRGHSEVVRAAARCTEASERTERPR